jgi:AcrR family transcriptional regulator
MSDGQGVGDERGGAPAGQATAEPRRRMRAPERRAQLLDVARRLFGTAGYHSVSMDAVAREAGVTKPILYDHFPSKHELYLALLDADLTSLHDRVRAALDAPTGNRERIRASFQTYFDFVDEHAQGFRLLMQETVGSEDDFRSLVESFRARILAEVADLIEREAKVALPRRQAETARADRDGGERRAARPRRPRACPARGAGRAGPAGVARDQRDRDRTAGSGVTQPHARRPADG